MDINDLRALLTVLGFVLFVALAWHTWSRRRRSEHEAAAMLPFADDIAQGDAAGPAAPNKPQGERRE